ncbi:glycoside hydrolase family 88 protein [Mucilaginibacter sabulilitoris]|uniref:Glycoside hydrolase family 88 protein n=1 Tax=Mucilaginibacter sabulilitoris TaxID=1173583 RepID=A0ABZ0TGT4_9SPHI|nr:glycoside hydrolase family 88 protein [Mucilaginibacter sabulilitoris]WPU92399.1 glycoside hydrolase family 88 protein [Mucilaginibacter sabulilitoris]
MMKKLLLAFTLLFSGLLLHAQTEKPWSQRMAATAMHLWQDSLPGHNWSYDQGVVLQGLQSVWLQTADNEYFKYIQRAADRYVTADGAIRTYKAENYTLDNILAGRSVLMLANVLNTPKYYKAVTLLRNQLSKHPRVPEGGFWHKKIYPDQMWLDGLYMAGPFYAQYAAVFHEDADFDDVANQFILMEKHARDPKTGLLYHGWDQSKKQKWANPQTGQSPVFWGRADGWYGMGLVDALDYFPANHPKRAELLTILNRFAAAITNYQDKNTGVWYQVLDKAGEKDNYLEASASCMFVYTLAKGVREGYLPAKYLPVAQKAYAGILKQFIETDAAGQVNIKGVCGAVGLGGNPYRDGSYKYYTSERPVVNETKGVGSFMLASAEIERLANAKAGMGKTVLLDSYFNNEHHKDMTGANIPFHYKWEEWDNNGFSLFGHIFNTYGLHTATLYQAPDAANLKKAAVYVITDPDIPKENPDAKYIEESHVKAISDWVKKGGVLLVLNNDTGNAEFKHLNKLMAKFGIQFNENSVNRVVGRQFEMGAINIPDDNTIFKTAKKIYIKELSTLQLTLPAVARLSNKNDIVVATARYGKGTVLAVGDPWFYNEYTDGRKLPADFDNFKAANDVVQWLVKQTTAK